MNKKAEGQANENDDTIVLDDESGAGIGAGEGGDEGNLESESAGEGQGTGEGQGAGEDDSVVVTIGEEPPPPEDEHANAPEWVRELRKKNREDTRRIRELEEQLRATKGEGQKPVTLGPKPTLEAHDYDADKYEAALANWYEQKRAVDEQNAKVKAGDMSCPEAMLLSQAHALDALFSNLARRAHGNMVEGYGDAAERYMKLALRAQSQCTRTLETLSAIKNPPVVFARQMNVSNGPQQVNNGVAATAPQPVAKEVTQAQQIDSATNKLSGESYELLPDTRASQAARRIDTPVEAMGEVHRAEDRRG